MCCINKKETIDVMLIQLMGKKSHENGIDELLERCSA